MNTPIPLHADQMNYEARYRSNGLLLAQFRYACDAINFFNGNKLDMVVIKLDTNSVILST